MAQAVGDGVGWCSPEQRTGEGAGTCDGVGHAQVCHSGGWGCAVLVGTDVAGGADGAGIAVHVVVAQAPGEHDSLVNGQTGACSQVQVAVCPINEQRKRRVLQVPGQVSGAPSIPQIVADQVVDDVNVRVGKAPLDGRKGGLR